MAGIDFNNLQSIYFGNTTVSKVYFGTVVNPIWEAIHTYTITPQLVGCTADASNPTTIKTDGNSVSLKFWTTDDYEFDVSIASVNVANANKVSWVVESYSYQQSGDSVVINNAPYVQTGDSVTID